MPQSLSHGRPRTARSFSLRPRWIRCSYATELQWKWRGLDRSRRAHFASVPRIRPPHSGLPNLRPSNIDPALYHNTFSTFEAYNQRKLLLPSYLRACPFNPPQIGPCPTLPPSENIVIFPLHRAPTDQDLAPSRFIQNNLVYENPGISHMGGDRTAHFPAQHVQDDWPYVENDSLEWVKWLLAAFAFPGLESPPTGFQVSPDSFSDGQADYQLRINQLLSQNYSLLPNYPEACIWRLVGKCIDGHRYGLTDPRARVLPAFEADPTLPCSQRLLECLSVLRDYVAVRYVVLAQNHISDFVANPRRFARWRLNIMAHERQSEEALEALRNPSPANRAPEPPGASHDDALGVINDIRFRRESTVGDINGTSFQNPGIRTHDHSMGLPPVPSIFPPANASFSEHISTAPPQDDPGMMFPDTSTNPMSPFENPGRGHSGASPAQVAAWSEEPIRQPLYQSDQPGASTARPQQPTSARTTSEVSRDQHDSINGPRLHQPGVSSPQMADSGTRQRRRAATEGESKRRSSQAWGGDDESLAHMD